MDLNLHSHFITDTSQSLQIALSANYFAASNAITNKLAQDYFLARFIDDNTKDGVSKNLKDKNYLNIEAAGELSFTFRPDSVHHGLQAFVALRQRNNFNIDFPKDAFELFFRGNKNYAGQTADISNANVQFLNYWQLAFGLGNEYKLEKGKLYVAADVGINSGIKFLTVKSNTATIYTEPTGEFINANLNAEIQTNDSSSSNTLSNNGVGFSGDFYSEYVTDNYIVRFSAENIGFIEWNKYSTQLKIDSAFTFDGVNVKDLFSFGDTVKSHVAFDSTYYYNFIRNRAQKRITTTLPSKISASYSRYFCQKKLFATVGADVLNSTHTAGRFFASGNYQVHKLNQIGMLLGYNTDAGLQGGLSFVHLFPKNLKIEIGSSYLFSMISYYAGTKQGAYLSINKSF
jgi:hypothetical protein